MAMSLGIRSFCFKLHTSFRLNLRCQASRRVFVPLTRCYSVQKDLNHEKEQLDELKVRDSMIQAHKQELTASTSDKREQFGLAIDTFKKREKYSKGHMELIKVAMTQMEELKLQKDVAIYNKIISIFPKGRFAPRRMLDAIWPRSIPQLELSLELLTKMEENGVRPNQETYDLLNEIFGKMSLPVQKCVRIAYLFDKYEFVDPYKVYVGVLPTDPVELSQFILKRITSHRGQIMVHKVSS